MSSLPPLPQRHGLRLIALLLLPIWLFLLALLVAGEMILLGLVTPYSDTGLAAYANEVINRGFMAWYYTYDWGLHPTPLRSWQSANFYGGYLSFGAVLLGFALVSVILPRLGSRLRLPLLLTFGFLVLATAYALQLDPFVADKLQAWVASLDTHWMREAEAIGAPVLEVSLGKLAALTDFPEASQHPGAVRALSQIQPITAEPGLIMPKAVKGTPSAEIWALAPFAVALTPVAIALALGMVIYLVALAFYARAPKAKGRLTLAAVTLPTMLLAVPFLLPAPLAASRNYLLVRRAILEEHGALQATLFDWTLTCHEYLYTLLALWR